MLPDALQLTTDPASSPAWAYPVDGYQEWTAVQGWESLHQGLQALARHREALRAAITAAEAAATPTPAHAATLQAHRMQLHIACAKIEALSWAVGLWQ
ncbi:hypothetical protein Q5H93_23620 [Hymenobacter sp. ASUV-10]|uniref:Uncharacterized protein n=1 Tax=Hymenobacter aranciens TaxID=3063996 RepID=A0ABT9BHK4_9BACT|nr:hypothetical protein [Hymenobacter sp. ASUV-10]MDO7877746.1 hypothetical protein [Hymenobacter sp. ASUV-10]